MFRYRRATLLAAAVLTVAAALPRGAAAQGRRVAPRPVVRSGAGVVRPHIYRPYYRPYYYSPAFYGYYGGFAGWYGGYGWYPYYARPYFYPYAYAYPYGAYYDYRGAAQLKVQPRHAQVFIDGYFVGTVDDFDGWLQRLHVAPGQHDLEVYLPGYRTFTQKVLFRPGATLRIEHVMQPIAPGEAEDPRPTPRPRAARPAPRRGADAEAAPAAPRRSGVRGEGYGAITVRVQPSDAEILIDGERWDTPSRGSLSVELSEGTHRVEVRKEGFRTYSADLPVRRGETSSVNVSLSRE